MRLTDFWLRMDTVFGESYARSWAADFRLAELGGLSVQEALAQGESAQDVWRAVCCHAEVEKSLR
ncbi:MAG: DUF3046 domain-containing protein [Candidatus Nanopelagicales bacterium]|nr:DUF3046 domain-containing protein [Candidatus Nanopelagicales bacterium]